MPPRARKRAPQAWSGATGGSLVATWCGGQAFCQSRANGLDTERSRRDRAQIAGGAAEAQGREGGALNRGPACAPGLAAPGIRGRPGIAGAVSGIRPRRLVPLPGFERTAAGARGRGGGGAAQAAQRAARSPQGAPGARHLSPCRSCRAPRTPRGRRRAQARHDPPPARSPEALPGPGAGKVPTEAMDAHGGGCEACPRRNEGAAPVPGKGQPASG